MKKALLLVSLMFTVAFAALAQERTVSGVVKDPTGETLPGVAVVIKGTTQGTVTGIDGAYRLIATGDNPTLVFKLVGYKNQEVVVGTQSTVSVSLEEDIEQLDEVVVTAFGLEKEEKSIGYAVQSVDGESLTKARETNIVNSLSGQVAGVQVTGASGSVGSSARIVLRGATSLTGNNQPLFVVDGMPISNDKDGTSNGNGGVDYGNGAMDINPDDIETMTVLKGPNAAALYGSRASNGVILITTKSGKKAKKGLGLSFNSTVTFENPLKTPDFQNAYDQGSNDQYFEFVDGANGYGDGVDESWGPKLDAGLMFYQFDGYDPDPSKRVKTPWKSNPDNFKEFFETGVTQSYNVAATNAGDFGSFRASYTYFDQTGMVPNTDLKRNTISLSGVGNLSDKLKVTSQIQYIKSESGNRSQGGYTGENPMQQFVWSGRQVDFAKLKDYNNLPLTPEGAPAAGTPLNWNTQYQNNPFWVMDNSINNQDKDRVIGNVRLSYEFTDWLTLFVRTGGDVSSDLREQKRAHGLLDDPNGFYSVINRGRSEFNTDFLLSFNKKINDDFSLSLSAGGNMMQQKYNYVYGEASQLELPGIYNLSNAKSGVPVSTQNYFEEKRINSLYGTGQIAFRNYLFLDFTARNDWSSTLPVDNNSYFYPSVSASAVISDILELESPILSYLKVRGGWAQVGSDTDPYELSQTFAFRNDAWNGISLPYEQTRLNNPTLRPEITSSLEFGIDARFFNGRIALDMTYYDQLSEDLIVPVTVTAASGYTSTIQNVGSMSNKGIEISLGGRAIDKPNFSWDVNLNFAKNINKVESLGIGDLESLRLGGQWNVDIQARPGDTYGSIYGPKFERVEDESSPYNGQIVYDQNGLPKISSTLGVLGNYTPDWTGGISNTFTYKGIALSFLIDAKMGGDVYTMTTTWGRYAGVLEETLQGRESGIVGDGVIESGDGTYVPNNISTTAKAFNQRAYSNSVAESSVFDASYIKLRNVSLGYTLPNNLMGRTPFRDVSINVVGRNLAILYSNVPHIDPETAFSNGNDQGMEFGQLPSATSYGFNIGFKL